MRQYPWGTCEALSSTHSDVGALKRLLFEDGYEELKSETNKRYFTYRSEQLLDDPSLWVHHPVLTILPAWPQTTYPICARQLSQLLNIGLQCHHASAMCLRAESPSLSRVLDCRASIGTPVQTAGSVF